MRAYDVVILGAGLAGASVARALCESGASNLLLIEREPRAGAHASGRSAGLVRSATEDAAIAPLAREGAAALRALGELFRCTGSLLIGAAGRIPEGVRAHPLHSTVDRIEVAKLVGMLHGAECDDALATTSDGWVDVPQLLARNLDGIRAAGGEIRLGLQAVGPRIKAGVVHGVDTEDGPIACRHLVVATGAWAAEWGAKAGIPVALQPYRRHLAVTRRTRHAAGRSHAHRSPWVWDLGRRFYFREHEDGVLWCGCDDAADRPGDAVADSAMWPSLQQKIRAALPAAENLQLLSLRAGHRTFAPDRRFLLGPDPRLPGWHWAAALGGHGVTVSSAIGRRVAAAILETGSIEAEFSWRSQVLAERENE